MGFNLAFKGLKTLSKEHQTHTQTYCNDIGPQTAQFYNERISTDLNLVKWQSTVHEPPEDGLKNGTETCRGKCLSVLMWILVLFKAYIVCVHELEYIYIYIYRVSQEECARHREGVPYDKVYRYNPKQLYPKLNGYGDNGYRDVWSSGGSTHCTCQLTSLIDVYPWVWCPNTESQLTLAYSRLIPECAVSNFTSVLAFMCHV